MLQHHNYSSQYPAQSQQASQPQYGTPYQPNMPQPYGTQQTHGTQQQYGGQHQPSMPQPYENQRPYGTQKPYGHSRPYGMWQQPPAMNYGVSQIHMNRKAYFAEASAQRKRFSDLRYAYFLLPAEQKWTQHPKFSWPATQCRRELAVHPTTRLPHDFDELQKLFPDIDFAIHQSWFPAAARLLAMAKGQIAAIRKLLDIVEGSCKALEDWTRHKGVWKKHDKLLLRVKDIDFDFQRLRRPVAEYPPGSPRGS